MTVIQNLLQDGRSWSLTMLLTFAFGALWIWYSSFTFPLPGTAGTASPNEGFAAPDFTLAALDGGEISLSELRGQVVVLNLWASWCLPCRAEMPAMEAVYQARRDEGLVILAVNSTVQDNEAEAAAFVEELGLTFPILLDREGTVSQRYRLQALPTTFFIDRQGVIREVVPGGPMAESLIESKIGELLAEGS